LIHLLPFQLWLPKLTDAGELPPGVHIADGRSSNRDSAVLSEASVADWASTDSSGTRCHIGELRRGLRLGSFVTGKPAPGDLDILLIMSEGFEVDRLAASGASRLRFTAGQACCSNSDVFWARASIGDQVLDVWLDTYQTSRRFSKTRYCGIGAAVIKPTIKC